MTQGLLNMGGTGTQSRPQVDQDLLNLYETRVTKYKHTIDHEQKKGKTKHCSFDIKLVVP